MSNLRKGYVDTAYLCDAASLLKRFKEQTYERMQIAPGHCVLDVGCGPGTDTIPLAGWVGRDGWAVGVDFDRAMVREARRRSQAAGAGDRALHLLADVTRGLPFSSGAFDSCRSERVFQHLLAPERALAEMARVTRPAGWIVVLDTDHSTKSFDTPEVDVERRLVRFAADHLHYNGYSGRTLYRLFKRQGLADIVVEAVAIAFTDCATARQANMLEQAEQQALAAGVITAEELARWRASLEQAQAEGVFFGTGTGVLIAGRKPHVR